MDAGTMVATKTPARPPLPPMVRIRLLAVRQIDTVACWLISHGYVGAAIVLWRICRLW